MSTFNNLQEASYRSIPFLMPIETQTKGHKTAVHEYLNSDERFIEELGKVPPTFTLQCVVHGTDSINNRLRFEQALDTSGFGELIHPVYGSLQVKVIGSYTVSSSQKRIGEHVFDVTFGVSKENISPQVKVISNAEISYQVEKGLDKISEVLGKNYQAVKKAFNIDSMANYFVNTIDNLTDSIETIETGLLPENVSVFVREAQKVQADIYNIVKSPDNISNKFKILYASFKDLTTSPAYMFPSLKALISTDPIDMPDNTFFRAQLRTNTLLLNEVTNLAILGSLYEATIYTDFKTDIDLLDAQQSISQYYQFFFEQEPDTNDQVQKLAEDLEVRTEFAYLNTLFYRSMAEKFQNVWKVKEIEERGSTPLIAYKYFGNLEALEIINELNPGINHANFEGNILMVSK